MDSLWGFEKEDIITSDGSESIFFEKEIKVKGIKVAGGKNEKEILIVKKGNKKGEFHKPNNLILLKRPGFIARVGTKIEDCFRVGSESRKGRVIVIDPFVVDLTVRFLVEFEENWVDGVDAREDWGKPWYPQRYKTDKKNRVWFYEKIAIAI